MPRSVSWKRDRPVGTRRAEGSRRGRRFRTRELAKGDAEKSSPPNRRSRTSQNENKKAESRKQRIEEEVEIEPEARKKRRLAAHGTRDDRDQGPRDESWTRVEKVQDGPSKKVQGQQTRGEVASGLCGPRATAVPRELVGGRGHAGVLAPDRPPRSPHSIRSKQEARESRNRGDHRCAPRAAKAARAASRSRRGSRRRNACCQPAVATGRFAKGLKPRAPSEDRKAPAASAAIEVRHSSSRPLAWNFS